MYSSAAARRMARLFLFLVQSEVIINFFSIAEYDRFNKILEWGFRIAIQAAILNPEP
jgi:hypothetical protein